MVLEHFGKGHTWNYKTRDIFELGDLFTWRNTTDFVIRMYYFIFLSTRKRPQISSNFYGKGDIVSDQ